MEEAPMSHNMKFLGQVEDYTLLSLDSNVILNKNLMHDAVQPNLKGPLINKLHEMHQKMIKNDFEWPILIIILLIICIIIGVGILLCWCMSKEADQDREYEKIEKEKSEK